MSTSAISMVDLSDKGSESEEMTSKTSDEGSSQGSHVKTCADCGTTKTPLWRGGPAGPKSLCNACGIRSRKKRRALLGINKGSTKDDRKPKRNNNNHSNSGSRNENENSDLGDSLKRKLLAWGRREVAWQRSTVAKLWRRRKLGEEEQAAVLLMALSCGSVYA